MMKFFFGPRWPIDHCGSSGNLWIFSHSTSREAPNLHASLFPYHGITPVTAHHQRGIDTLFLTVNQCADTVNRAVLFDKARHLRIVQQGEGRQQSGFTADEIEKIPLRHKRDELALRWQMTEVSQRGLFPINFAIQFFGTLMRKLQEFVEKTQPPDDLQRRRVNGVAAKIAQEIGVLLQYRDAYAFARQQIPEH